MSAPRVITAFEKADRRGTRVRVFVNDAPWVELDAETAVREHLTRNLLLTPAREQAILATDEWVRARKAAAGHAQRQPKTRHELEAFLRGRSFTPAAIERALEALESSGTIDDPRVAARAVRQKRRKALGPRRVAAELRARGLDEKLVRTELNAALDGVDLIAECRALLEKHRHKYEPLSDPKQHHKLISFLLRRGYPADAVHQALQPPNL